RNMALDFRIQFQTPGRYTLRARMRGAGTETTDDVPVYWNRRPAGQSQPDFTLKIQGTNYAWSASTKDVSASTDGSVSGENPDYAAKGFPVEKPGLYTLYIAKGPEPYAADHTPGTDADFFALERFELKRVGPPEEPGH